MPIILFGHNLLPLLIIFAGSLFLTIGDIIAKLWVVSNRPLYFAVTLGLYLIGLVFLILSFRFKNIAVASMLLIGLNVLTLALWSWLVYDEPLNRAELAGLVLGFIALGLLEWGEQAA